MEDWLNRRLATCFLLGAALGFAGLHVVGWIVDGLMWGF